MSLATLYCAGGYLLLANYLLSIKLMYMHGRDLNPDWFMISQQAFGFAEVYIPIMCVVLPP